MPVRRSPLEQLINSSILIETPSETVLSNGRFDAPIAHRYLVKTYLQREDGEGTDDGQIPSYGSRSSSGGGLTSTWTFRGYILSYVEVSSTYKHGTSEAGLIWEPIINSTNDGIMIPIIPRMKCTIRHGNSGMLYYGDITIVGGKYQGLGPDTTIYYELQGAPITLRGNVTI